jgi:hypothetical protein
MQVPTANSFSRQVQAIALVAILFSLAALGQQPTLHQQILQIVDQHSSHFSGISTGDDVWRRFRQLDARRQWVGQKEADDEGDCGDGSGCGNGRGEADGASRTTGSDKRGCGSDSCLGIHRR